MATDELTITERKSITFRPNDEEALTFLKPFSGEWGNHLIVIFEDAYGDYGSSMLHRKSILEKYNIDEETLDEIFKKIEQWK